MKKLLTITAVSFALAIAACSSPPPPAPKPSSLALKKPTKDQLVEESANKCETLGFERGTKEFRDCAVTQFNKMQDKYY